MCVKISSCIVEEHISALFLSQLEVGTMTEADYQKKLKSKLTRMFPGCKVKKQDTSVNQGEPDLIILFRDKWAMLEVKKDQKAKHQPNQDEIVSEYNAMSFARFIFPQNETEVLNELRSFFGTE